jgi:hypothetical protein
MLSWSQGARRNGLRIVITVTAYQRRQVRPGVLPEQRRRRLRDRQRRLLRLHVLNTSAAYQVGEIRPGVLPKQIRG